MYSLESIRRELAFLSLFESLIWYFVLELTDKTSNPTQNQCLATPKLFKFNPNSSFKMSKLKKLYKEAAVLCLGVGTGLWIDSECYSLVVGQGPSMLPTFGTNNVLTVNRLKWKFGKFTKGDILFTMTPHDNSTMVVKRLKHLPGETVELNDGSTYKLEHNQYWVEGDNAERSFDSRHFGPVPRHMVAGVVTGVIYPKVEWFN